MAEPSTKRFSDANLAVWANQAQRQMSFEVDWPFSVQTITTVPNQQLYQLIELMKVMRIYMVGANGSQQELLATDIYTLEGDIIQVYDNSSGQQQGNPVQTPAWLVQPPQSYPVTSEITLTGRGSGPVPTKDAWGIGARPRYFMYGGSIGIVPTPATASPQTVIRVEGVGMPQDMFVSTDNCLYPDLCLDAIMWKMVTYARYSDNSSLVQQAEMAYQNEMFTKVRPWLERMQATKPKTLVPITKRSYFRRRGNY